MALSPACALRCQAPTCRSRRCSTAPSTMSCRTRRCAARSRRRSYSRPTRLTDHIKLFGEASFARVDGFGKFQPAFSSTAGGGTLPVVLKGDNGFPGTGNTTADGQLRALIRAGAGLPLTSATSINVGKFSTREIGDQERLHAASTPRARRSSARKGDFNAMNRDIHWDWYAQYGHLTGIRPQSFNVARTSRRPVPPAPTRWSSTARWSARDRAGASFNPRPGLHALRPDQRRRPAGGDRMPTASPPRPSRRQGGRWSPRATSARSTRHHPARRPGERRPAAVELPQGTAGCSCRIRSAPPGLCSSTRSAPAAAGFRCDAKAYAEVARPDPMKDLPFFDDLSIEGAIRESNYSTIGHADQYRVAGRVDASRGHPLPRPA